MDVEYADVSPGYRMTELGPLPEEWQVVRLGEVYEIQQGKALSRKKDKGIRPRPFLRTANVLWGKVDLSTLDQMDFTVEEEQKYALKSGDLLICEGGEIGRTAIWEGQMQGVFYQNHIFRVRATTQETDPRFHMYWMQAAITLLGLYRGRGNKTTIPNLSKRRLAEFPIPLPPLPEQRAIAYVLRRVQEAKEKTEEVIKALKELKKSLMRHLFTYGPVPLDRISEVKLKETEIGMIPEHWEVVRLGTLRKHDAVWVKNGFPQGKFNEDRVGVPHLRPFNITNDGKISLKQIKYVQTPPKDSPYWLRKGDILFNNTNSENLVGKVAYFDLDGRFVLSNHMTIIRILKKDLNPLWVASWLLLLWQRGFTQSFARRHVNQASISLSRLENIPIPLPPLPEQRQIARMLRAVDEKIEAEEKRKKALDTLFRTLLHDLMTAKRRLPKGFVKRFE